MNGSKRIRLQETGQTVEATVGLLRLKPSEAAYVELKVRLAVQLFDLRQRLHLTQRGVAALMGSSQSRVARMEVADSLVSLDLLVRSLLVLGVKARSITAIVQRVLTART